MGTKPQTRKSKPDTELVKMTYDQLEIALVALSIRQEELREARSMENNRELEILWTVCDKMDEAQRRLESRMSTEAEQWLTEITEKNQGQASQKSRTRQEPSQASKLAVAAVSDYPAVAGFTI